MKKYRELTPDQVANLQRLIRDFPHLPNAHVGQLIGCSDSSVGAERRGTRTVRTDEKRAEFERAKAALRASLPSMEDDEAPQETFLSVVPKGRDQARQPGIKMPEQEAEELAVQIRVQALKKLRQQLTEGEISPDDVLAVLGYRS